MARYTIDLFSFRTRFSDVDDDGIPMGMFVIETSTGSIVFSWAFESDKVNSDDILAVLAEAIRGRTIAETGLFLGGLCDTVQCDNATIHVSQAMRKALARFGVTLLSNNSYRSRELGGHERKHGTARTRFLRALPGSSDGPRARSGALMPDPRRLITLEEARELLEAFADERNNIAREDGLTPLQAWANASADGILPRRAGAAELARLATEYPTTCKRYTPGVLVNTRYFSNDVMSKRPDKRFRVRYWLRDKRTVELFGTDGTFVGSAAWAPTAAEMQAIKATEAADDLVADASISAARAAEALVQQAGDTEATNAASAAAAESLPVAAADSPSDATVVGTDHLSVTGLLSSIRTDDEGSS